MDVDALMDLAITAGRDVFGRAVTYTPALGAAVSGLSAIYTPASSFQVPELGGLDTGMPRLEFRTADLVDESITPAAGDTVAFTVEDVARTYKVVRVVKGDVGSTLLMLGEPS